MRLVGLAAAVILLAGCGGGPAAGSSSQSPGAQSSGTRTVISPVGLRVRGQPSETGSELARLLQGTAVEVDGHDSGSGGWYHVRVGDVTGWISADPALSSPHRFQLYQSTTKGLSALYPAGWSFSDRPEGTLFRPPAQGGDQWIFVHVAPTSDGLGPPGRPGYVIARTGSVQVNGVTGLLRDFDRGPSASPGPEGARALAHLQEVGIGGFGNEALRADFVYDTPDQLGDFVDFYNSLLALTSAATPVPSAPAPSAPAPA